ncbi:hypothetical protein BJX64DRAFT_112129 [Aspergillus heterothallicus]
MILRLATSFWLNFWLGKHAQFPSIALYREQSKFLASENNPLHTMQLLPVFRGYPVVSGTHYPSFPFLLGVAEAHIPSSAFRPFRYPCL